MAAHALWAMQGIGHIPAINHESSPEIQQRHGSVVMAYIDDIVIATGTIEDHLVE